MKPEGMAPGVKDALTDLIFSDKEPPSFSLPRSFAQTTTRTRVQAVLGCQQSPPTVYHGTGNSSSVVYVKNAGKSRHETLDSEYTEQQRPRLICSLWPRPALERLCYVAGYGKSIN